MKAVTDFGDMTEKQKLDLSLSTTADISQGFFPLTKNLNADGSIRLSFDSVLTKSRYDSNWAPTVANPNKYPFVTRALSTMKGARYTITIRASNATGASAPSDDAVVGTTRQVFGTKAAYELLLPNIDISLLNADGEDISFSDTTGGIAEFGVTMRDLSDAEIEGRRVDEVEYRVYQTLANGSEYDIIAKSQKSIASGNLGAGAEFSFIEGAVGSTGHGARGKATFMLAANSYKMGYPIKAEFKYRSVKNKELAKTPAQAGDLIDSSEDYKTLTKNITFATIPQDTHDEVGHMLADDGDGKITISWSKPTAQYDAVLTGYVVDLYDISSGEVEVRAASGSGSSALAQVKTNLSDPANKLSSGVLAKTITSYEFTGLENGKNYMAVVHTVTTQGTVSVTSNGRCLGTVGNVENTEVIKYGHDNTFGSFVYFAAPATGIATKNYFDPTQCAKPRGIPLVTANVADQELTIDNNGGTILYGAMIQVQTTATTTTLAAPATGTVDGVPNTATANTNVFYLDLSLGTLKGVSTSEIYKNTDGYGLPNRKVYTVKKGFLGDGWTDETNYIFVSNKAGTLAGKIENSIHSSPL